jgi:glycosyltransferase involved in cell wall biosynthesis
MNPRSVVVMPTFARPEFLALSLEKVANASNAPDDVRIFLDTCSDERLVEVEYVRDTYLSTAEIYRAESHIICPSGTWNILNSLKQGYETDADYIFFVEEDVLIRPTFFDAHYQLQMEGDYFVTCGRKLRNRDENYYSNPGTCYRREKLEAVLPHIDLKYFRDQENYLDRTFGPMDDAGILDDGLIRRVMRSVDGKAKCAVPSIAVHQGFHHYNRSTDYQIDGPIEERIESLRVMLTRVDPGNRFTRDFEVF